MPDRTSRVSATLVILVLLSAPLVAHFAMLVHRGLPLAEGMVAMQAVLVAWIVTSPLRQRWARVCACGAIFVLALVLADFSEGGPVVAAAVPHAMAYLALLAMFAASLAPGKEPLVTILARRSRGHLRAETVRYTRRVTWAWCWFFIAQLAASLLLLWFAPLTVWSLFINLFNLPLIGVMFGAEYTYRQWRHAAQPPERLVDMLRVFRQARAVPAHEDR